MPAAIAEDWSRWYTRSYAKEPERCFQELSGSIPRYVKNVIDFGCANGRNLSVFNGTHRLYGVDLVPEANIDWLIPLKDLTYIQSRLQDFRIELSMADFLCITHGTTMYLAPNEQRSFLGYLVEKGCKNFILQEYDGPTCRKDGYYPPSLWRRRRPRRVGYPFSNPFDFQKRWYRPEIPVWIQLDAKSDSQA